MRGHRKEPTGQGCAACGLCCELYGGELSASEEDLARWRSERPDLLLRVGANGALWVDPSSGRPEEGCPFLVRRGPESAVCSIHDTKPAICRGYPTLLHGPQCVGRRFPGAVRPQRP